MKKYSKMFLSSHAFVPINEVASPLSLCRELEAERKYDGAPIEMHKIVRGGFGFPLHYFRSPEDEADEVIDDRAEGGQLTFRKNPKLWSSQEKVLTGFETFVARGKTGFILESPAGSGKCHGKGVELLLYGGSFKKAEDVRVGDLLMGPDSKPREVLSTTRGMDDMFKITPVKGEAFTCNKAHILSLKYSWASGSKYSWDGGPPHIKGNIVNISVADYLKKAQNFKNQTKLWRIGVEFPELWTEIDPYIVGLYIGDGHRSPGLALTLGDKDEKVVKYVREWAQKNGLWIRERRGRGCTMYHISTAKSEIERGKKGSNWFRNFVRTSIDATGEKRIPPIYLINNRRVRLQVLAGLLDADGHLRNGYFEITTKFKGLAEDLAFLCRSLDFAAYVSKKRATIKSSGFSGLYYRVGISGELSEIPCRLDRKKASPRRQKKDVLNTGFKIESLGKGEYFGFELSGDGLYLLKDFTVTHNTIMGIAMIGLIGRTALVIVPRSNLVDQWVKRICHFTGLRRDEVGVIEGKRCSWIGKKIVVALVHTVALDKQEPYFKKCFGTVLFDEVDRSVPPTTFATVVAMFSSKYRIGMSATLKRQDGLEVVFQQHIGEAYLKSTSDENRMLPTVLMIDFKGNSGYVHPASPKLNRRGMLLSRLASNLKRNVLLTNYILLVYKSERRCIVLSDRTVQLVDLRQLLVSKKVPQHQIGFYCKTLPGAGKKKKVTVPLEERKRAATDCRIVLATYGMIAIGTDIPDMGGIVNGTPQSAVTQSSGRIERYVEGKKNPVIVDIVDVHYKDARIWAKNRERQYSKKGLTIKRII